VTCILFPLEVAFGILEKSAIQVQEFVVGADFGKVSGLKGAIKPIVSFLLDNLGSTVGLILSLILLFMSLTLMVKIMRAIFIHKMARVLDRFLFKNAVTAFIVGISRDADGLLNAIMETGSPDDTIQRRILGLVMLLRYLKRIAAHLKNICTAISNPFPKIGFRPSSY
jgi:hypothetical protein